MEDTIKKQVKFIGKKVLQISELEKKDCKFYSVTIEGEANVTVNHHILLVDISGSMHYEIPELKKRLKSTLDALKKGGNNYVSVITYSGHDESTRIINAVKCDTISYKMAQVDQIIEEQIYSKGVTVMSEPLESAVEIVTTLADVCDKHEIILFTDGCLVSVKWNEKEEINKCLKVAEICKNKGIFFNAIGFGAYYDREFLKLLVSKVGTGALMHINEIKDYNKTIIEMANEVNSKEIITTDIDCNDFFVLKDRDRFKEKTTINSLMRNKENIIVTFDTDLNIDEKTIKSSNKKISDELLEEFFYSLAFYHIMNEDIDSTEVALAQTKDLDAYMTLNNNYSFIEKGNSINKLNELIENKEKRFRKGKADIKVILPEEEPMCLLEVLKEILADGQSSLLWDYQYEYKRIGIKKTISDDNYKFIRPHFGYGQVVDVAIGSKKLNIGVKVKIDGQVENIINKLKLDACIYREYNLIVNGNVNTPYIWCTLSKQLKTKFRKEKLIKAVAKYNNLEICTLDIRKLKSTNKRLFKSLNQKEIAHYLYDVEVLRVKQWALNKAVKELLSSNKLKKIDFENEISEVERAIRKEFRVDYNGVYIPPVVTKEVSENYEVYIAEVVEWKIEKFPKKKQEEIAIKEVNNLIESDVNKTYDNLITELRAVKEEKAFKERLINLVRLSSALINKPLFIWDKELEKEKENFDKELNTNSVVGEKTKISSKNIDGINVREDRYRLLTKC